MRSHLTAFVGRDRGREVLWDVHDGQLPALKSESRFTIVPAGRRWGKSDVAVRWVLHRGMDARMAGVEGVIWIIYPTYKVARVAWRKFKKLAPPRWITHYVGTDLHPEAIKMGDVTIEFQSGVKPETLVGEGLLAAWIDECGEIKERVWIESIRPTLMDHRAPAFLTGTPKGHNWFWRMYGRGWEEPGKAILSLGVDSGQGFPSHGNPWIPLDEIDDIARDLTERAYQQEILAHFLSQEGAVFRLDRIREKGLGFSTAPTVALGVDLARRADFTVMIGLDRDYATTYFERFKDIDWPLQRRRIEAVWDRLGRPTIVMDSTGVGDPVVQELQATSVPVEPYYFTGTSKRALVEQLALACDDAAVTLPDEPVLLNEMESFDMTQLPSGNVRYSAPEGQHDDCVMALGLALYGAMRYGDLGITLIPSRERAEAEERGLRRIQ
jgi:hypothetical protein